MEIQITSDGSKHKRPRTIALREHHGYQGFDKYLVSNSSLLKVKKSIDFDHLYPLNQIVNVPYSLISKAANDIVLHLWLSSLGLTPNR